MAKIVTLKERKARALAARRAAHDRLLPRLADEAARYGGRYILFGSAARGELRANSDVDLLADFPPECAAAAVRAAEHACAELGLQCDIMEQRACSAAFVARVLPVSRVLA